ncbi:TIM-barrel domain-containing protein [Hymenobacter koreensis]|uniref:DUF5110 domain-containing protein n=1 Tax=Hymenobacter koreensis TaxID=1084523 RepID=A0ABP8IUZ4_9BACT
MPFRFRQLPLVWMFFTALPALAQREGDRPPAQDPFTRPVAPVRATAGNYQSHSYQNNILTIKSTNGATLRVRPWAESVVKVEYFPPGQPVRPDSSVSVVQAPSRAFPNSCSIGCTGQKTAAINRRTNNSTFYCAGISESSSHFTWSIGCPGEIVIQKKPLRISYQRDGEALVSEATGPFQQVATSSTTPSGTGVSFRLSPDERLYGTGSRALPLDRRGRKLTLYNEAHYSYQNGESTLNVTLPTVVSSRGYMLFFDHHTAGTLDLGATDKNTLEYRGEGLNNLAYFIIAGDSYAEILNRYTVLTGRQPLPPRWGMGLIQSRFGYKTEQEMYQVAGRMRRAGFPLDALVLDLYWFGGIKQQGDFRWVPQNFPDPKRMMRRLDSAGVKTILISEPYVMRTSRNDSLVRTQGYVGRGLNGKPYTVESFWAGPATLVDMFRPKARQWMWQQYDRLKQDGVGGWWSDLGEPENQPADMVYDLGPTRRIHNAYGQAWSTILSENYARQYPQERLFNLARSGWAGMQRNSVFPWSGDVNRSWSGYQAQVPIMLSMGLGGVGYMHSDAGGFCVGPVDAELYTRWLQMASLGPILRPHGEGVPPEPYWYPEKYQRVVRDYTHLRYQLLPYLYSLAWENNQTGTPLTRPMNYGDTYLLPEAAEPAVMTKEERENSSFSGEFHPTWNWSNTDYEPWRNDPRQVSAQQKLKASNAPLNNVNDQFFLGSSLLVAPVLQPGQRRRNVVLPTGNWIDFYTHETLPGGRTVGRPAPLERLPLLVRAGAILPMTRYVSSTAQYRLDTLRVRYYADFSAPQSSFQLYDDDGRSAQVDQTKAFQLISFEGSANAERTELRVAVHGKGYPGVPARRTVELRIPRVAAAPASVLLNNAPLEASAWQYEAATQHLRLHFTVAEQPVTLSLPNLQLNTAPAAHTEPEILTLEAPDNRTFDKRVELRYTLHQAGQLGPLRIVDSRGQLVRTIAPATAVGPHTLTWNATNEQGQAVPGGVYWAELAGQRQRLVLLR